VSHAQTLPTKQVAYREQRTSDPFEPTPMRSQSGRCTLLVLPAVVSLFLSVGIASGSQFASHVETYVPGDGVIASDPLVALGEPARLSPDPTWGTTVVSMVNPPYLGSQIVQLGVGGSLTVRFDQPIANSPSHSYGSDLIVFSNSFFVPANYTDWPMSNPAFLFTSGTGKLEVSANGQDYFEIPGAMASRLFPTLGYSDSGPVDGVPGLVPTDFHKPVNPALTLSAFDGLTFAQAVVLYEGSGGGMPVDIAGAVDGLGYPAGLSSISYVRVTNVGTSTLSIDAFSVVPEPITALLLPLAVAAAALRRSRR
jgi:hypothetical protein